jgi:hypothetical protein
MIRRTLACGTMLLSLATGASTHPRGSTMALAELNDYLAAVQWLAESDPAAEKLFEQWQVVREESWTIRALTDSGDLGIDDPHVVEQVQTVRALRRQLLDECRRFFSAPPAALPVAVVRVSDSISVDWADPLIETPVGARRLVLIEVRNDSDGTVDVEVSGGSGRQVFTWRKTVHLDPGRVRHAFAHVAPVIEGPLTGTIDVRSSTGDQARLRIRAAGTADPSAPPTLPERSIHLRVRDAETMAPLAARVEVRDAEGEGYWEPLAGASHAVPQTEYGWETPFWPLELGPYFYTDGAITLGVDPEGKTVRAYHGFEYRAAEAGVPEDGRVQLALRRWIDMAERGWYSGQTHIHTTDVGMPVPFTGDWPLVARAEDIGVTNILTLKGEWTSHAIYANEYPMGVVPWASDERHVIAYGEEYRNNPYGHVCLLGLRRLLEPVSSGALGELGGPDYPPNLFVLDAALADGATTVGAHFGGSILDDAPIATPWPSTGFEMPADVALGRLHVAEIYGNAGERDVWYRLLNCGFELAATAGPDWVIKDTPRTYVFLGGEPLSFEAWTEGLRLGRSFVTQGPMLFFEVEGQRPGARLHFPERSRALRVRASALLPDRSLPVEIVVNGEVVATGTDISTTIEIEESAWLAARTEDAHANPVYVTLAGRPRGRAEDAGVFVGVLDRLADWVRRKGLFDTPEQRETVLNVIGQGRAVYESIVERAGKD